MANTKDTQGQSNWEDWVGADVVDDDGDKIGSIQNIYMDRSTGQPEWLAVKTGLFGSNSSFVPIQGAAAADEDLRVPYSKDLVKDAPNVDEDGEGYLSPEEERQLYEHYDQDYQEWAESDVDVETTTRTDTGQDTSGPNTDNAMTRSEEELRTETRSKEAGRVRLRKYVVTENVTTTVPVRKEVARIVREPVEGQNAGDIDVGEDVEEIVLSQEEVVVDKKVVAKERVRLEKDVETEQQEVSGEVRKERIDVDGDVETTEGGR